VSEWGEDLGGAWVALFVGDPRRGRTVDAPEGEHFPPAELDGYRLSSANETTRVATYRATYRAATESAKVRPNTCGRCDATWTAKRAAHCGGCCRTFATVVLFDAHRSADGPHGTCLDPETVVGESGHRRLFFRDGMWRGPELTDEQRANLNRVWGGEADDAIPAWRGRCRSDEHAESGPECH
jgi:hypothetical protein